MYFKDDDDDIYEIMAKETFRELMFKSVECNKKYFDARNLTYAQFVLKYVYIRIRDVGNQDKRVTPLEDLYGFPQQLVNFST